LQSCAAASAVDAPRRAIDGGAMTDATASPSAPRAPQSASRQHLWQAIIASAFLVLPLGSIYAFSVLLKPLEMLLGVSRSELAFVFGLSTVCFTIGVNLAPRLLRYAGAIALLFWSSIVNAAGMALSAVASGVVELAIGYGILYGLGGGVGYMVMQQGINLMATSRSGLINGYLVGLLPAGAMVSTLGFGWGLAHHGVRWTIAGLAIVLGVTGVLGSLLARTAGMRLSENEGGVSQAVQTVEQRRTFWKMFTVFFLAASAGLTVLSQAAGIVVAYGGTTGAALAATTGITAAIAFARLTGGWLTDRFSFRAVMGGAQSLALAGAVILTAWPEASVSIVCLTMVGMGYGFVSGATVGAVAAYWPKEMFAAVASRLYIAWCGAALSLPVVAAWLYDLTGGYGAAVMIAGVGNLVAVLVALTMPLQRLQA